MLTNPLFPGPQPHAKTRLYSLKNSLLYRRARRSPWATYSRAVTGFYVTSTSIPPDPTNVPNKSPPKQGPQNSHQARIPNNGLRRPTRERARAARPARPRTHHASRSHTCGGGGRAVFHQRCRTGLGRARIRCEQILCCMFTPLPSPLLFFSASLTHLMTSPSSSPPPSHPTKTRTTNHSYLNRSPYPGLTTSSLRCVSTRFLKGRSSA